MLIFTKNENALLDTKLQHCAPAYQLIDEYDYWAVVERINYHVQNTLQIHICILYPWKLDKINHVPHKRIFTEKRQLI